MERGVRDCCRSLRVGKILIRRDQETRNPKVYYAKFPPQIDKRQVLLLYPILGELHVASCQVGITPGGLSNQSCLSVSPIKV